MDRQRLPVLPSVLYERRAADIMCLLKDIDLAQTIEAICRIRPCRNRQVMSFGGVLNVPQPIVNQTKRRSLVGGTHATAAIMAAHDHMLYAQHIDGVLQYREAVKIRVHHEIGDIAVDENLAGRQPDDLIRRHAAIGATDPQIPRCLLRGKASEEIRIGTKRGLRPAPVIRKEMFQRHF